MVINASTMFAAVSVPVIQLTMKGGITAVPWHLVCYTIPGVIIGAQIGTRIQGKISSDKMQKSIAILFLIVGTLLIVTYVRG